jgi:hypothetical protein
MSDREPVDQIFLAFVAGAVLSIPLLALLDERDGGAKRARQYSFIFLGGDFDSRSPACNPLQ